LGETPYFFFLPFFPLALLLIALGLLFPKNNQWSFTRFKKKTQARQGFLFYSNVFYY
jgi:hypothetical protein